VFPSVFPRIFLGFSPSFQIGQNSEKTWGKSREYLGNTWGKLKPGKTERKLEENTRKMLRKYRENLGKI
jgi:hypothetical protein